MKISRRSFVSSVSLSSAALASGCCLIRPPPASLCFNTVDWEDKSQFLAIDVHAHFFNASDLQVKEFINRVGLKDKGSLGEFAKKFGRPLQEIGWLISPSTEKELRILNRWEPDSCESDPQQLAVRTARGEMYDKSRGALLKYADQRKNALTAELANTSGAKKLNLEMEQEGLREIEELPECLEGFSEKPCSPVGGGSNPVIRQVTISSLLEFLLEMFQYRSSSIYRFLDLYSRRSAVKLDLVCPSLVDFDWPLAKGKKTEPSPLSEQIQAHKRIAQLTRGKVHALAPFDPFREVAFSLGKAPRSSLEIVQDAVDNQGAIGIKLYPPMGFAALGNEGRDVWKDKDWLPGFACKAGFGGQLDRAMEKLFAWCIKDDVPIMAHTNATNTPHDDFIQLIGFEFWKNALEAYPGLRVNFGHFGGAGNKSINDQQVRGFFSLMSDSLNGTNAYADVGYFTSLVNNPGKLEQGIKDSLADADLKEATQHKLVYGSDWKMLVKEKEAPEYSDRFSRILDKFQENWPELKPSLYGNNAADYLGLHDGMENRGRLETFYKDHRVSRPLWMDKVDRI